MMSLLSIIGCLLFLLAVEIAAKQGEKRFVITAEFDGKEISRIEFSATHSEMLKLVSLVNLMKPPRELVMDVREAELSHEKPPP